MRFQGISPTLVAQLTTPSSTGRSLFRPSSARSCENRSSGRKTPRPTKVAPGRLHSDTTSDRGGAWQAPLLVGSRSNPHAVRGSALGDLVCVLFKCGRLFWGIPMLWRVSDSTRHPCDLTRHPEQHKGTYVHNRVLHGGKSAVFSWATFNFFFSQIRL